LIYYLKNVEQLSAQHNYGWFLSGSTDVGGGRLLEGALAAISREEWRKLLVDFKPGVTDYQDYKEHLSKISAQDPIEDEDSEDASLTGYEAFSPLLQSGYEQGVGPLNPVGVVTARDLLNYGWEMSGMQMGARHYFVASRWGIPDLADAIHKRVARVSGQAPFFPLADQNKAPAFDRMLYRLQLVDDIVWRIKVDMHPFAKDATDPAAAHLFQRRCWLRPYYVTWQAWAFCMARLRPEVVPHLRRYHEECGLKSDVYTLEYINDFDARDYEIPDWKGLRELKKEVAEAFPDPTSLQIRLLHGEPATKMYSEQWGQKYEELFWKNPDCGLEQQILVSYINGGAWKSAKRFYTEVRQVVDRDVGFSNFSAPLAWALGFVSEDEDLMRMAVQDSNSGSADSMWTLFWNAVAHDKLDQAEEQLSEMISRYYSRSGPKASARVILDFLPLVKALKDPKSPDYTKAMDYFGSSASGVVFRWILIEKYNLPPADAIRFLGGSDADQIRKAIVDFQQNSKNSGAARVLCQWTARQTLPVLLKIEEKDLMPPGAKSLTQAVLAARGKRNR
jgi:hypothetical protein